MPNKTTKAKKPKTQRPPQKQSRQPGRESRMRPVPSSVMAEIEPGARLEGLRAFITGGDSGIGRAVAAAFAREGANVAICYLEEEEDAQQTRELVEERGRRCVTIRADISREDRIRGAVRRAAKDLGGLDILVNNAAVQFPEESIVDIKRAQLEHTFRTNLFAMFYAVQEALPYLQRSEWASIINTTSVTAYRGSGGLLDYSATKGAIVSFTRSLSDNLADKKIRVNAVAPGPIWTPLIPATFDAKKVSQFGSEVPMGRAGQPDECAGCYVFLASREASYITGQVLHPNGGEIVNG